MSHETGIRLRAYPRCGACRPARNVLPQIRAKPLDALAGLLEGRSRGRIGKTEGGAETERGALHQRYAFGVEQFGDEILVRHDLFAGWRGSPDNAGAGRIDVERPLGPRAFDALGLVEHGDAEVAAFLENPVVLGDEV